MEWLFLAPALGALGALAAFVLVRRSAGLRRAKASRAFVGIQDFSALIAALQAGGQDGSFWAALVPGTEQGDGCAANLQFSIENGELGMDWVLVAQSNIALKERFMRIAAEEGLEPREVEMNGVKYVRATGARDWARIGGRLLSEMFGEARTAKMPLVVTGFKWSPR